MRNAETSKFSYCSKSKIIEMCLELGYEIIEFEDKKDGDGLYSWAEIKCPGNLHTARLRQVLGKVIPN
jgi:hypothetical protein